MKKIVWIGLLLIWTTGCVTVKIPKYLKDEFPYKKTFYFNFDDTLKSTQLALKDMGWRISDVSNPTVFEQNQTSDKSVRQVLIFTEVRQTPLIFSSRYMSLNIYVRSLDNKSTDVEIRYLSVTPIVFTSAESHKNDAVIEKIFHRISQLLGE